MKKIFKSLIIIFSILGLSILSLLNYFWINKKINFTDSFKFNSEDKMIKRTIVQNDDITSEILPTFNEAGQLEFGPGEIVVTILAIIAVALGIWIIWLKLFKPKLKDKDDLNKSKLINKKNEKKSKIKSFFSKIKKTKENNIEEAKIIDNKNGKNKMKKEEKNNDKTNSEKEKKNN